MGDLLTRWSVRLAMSLYILALSLRWNARGRPHWQQAARLFWTVGCAAFLAHVLLAFGVFHHWSHAEAYRATAADTERAVGFSWGGGLYMNYLFALVWVLDCCWWWSGLDAYNERSRAVCWIIQGYLAFMAFNATVIFASGFSRWLGVAACLLLIVPTVRWLRARAAER